MWNPFRVMSITVMVLAGFKKIQQGILTPTIPSPPSLSHIIPCVVWLQMHQLNRCQQPEKSEKEAGSGQEGSVITALGPDVQEKARGP